MRLRGVPLLEPHERVPAQARRGELIRLEDPLARVFVVPGRVTQAADAVPHARPRRVPVELLPHHVRRDRVLAPVVEVAHPDEVVERLHALHLLAEETPADNLGEIVVAARALVVVRGEVRVQETHRRVPDATRDADAAFVREDVADPRRLGGRAPPPDGGRDVGASEKRHPHLPQRVATRQHVRIAERARDAREPIVLALGEPLARRVLTLLATDDDELVLAPAPRVDAHRGVVDGARRRLSEVILALLLRHRSARVDRVGGGVRVDVRVRLRGVAPSVVARRLIRGVVERHRAFRAFRPVASRPAFPGRRRFLRAPETSSGGLLLLVAAALVLVLVLLLLLLILDLVPVRVRVFVFVLRV